MREGGNFTSQHGAGGANDAGMAEDKRKKRFRRTANAIERRFTCWCGKAYGSEGSLNQHKKNKEHFVEPAEGIGMDIDSIPEIAQHGQADQMRQPMVGMMQPSRGLVP